MNRKAKPFVLLLVLVLSLGLMAGCSTQKTTETPSTTPSASSDETSAAKINVAVYGAAGALTDEDLTVEKMLIYAIQDEFLAHGEYEYILQTFGDQNPFNNIIKAEEQHIAELKILFGKYKVNVPEDKSREHLILPANIKGALETGVQAEIDNIAMYKKFLEQDLPADVKSTFALLLKGSENHLAAFQNNLNKY